MTSPGSRGYIQRLNLLCASLYSLPLLWLLGVDVWVLILVAIFSYVSVTVGTSNDKRSLGIPFGYLVWLPGIVLSSMNSQLQGLPSSLALVLTGALVTVAVSRSTCYEARQVRNALLVLLTLHSLLATIVFIIGFFVDPNLPSIRTLSCQLLECSSYQDRILGQQLLRILATTETFFDRLASRPTGLFLYGPEASAGSLIGLFLALASKDELKKRVYWGVLAINVMALLSFLTRMPILAAGASVLWRVVKTTRQRVLAGILVAVSLIYVFVVGNEDDTWAFVTSVVNPSVLGRSMASTEDRLNVYEATLEDLFKRVYLAPVLGAGAEKEVAYAKYPLGSHSGYLNVLYTHGLLGLVGFSLVLYKTYASMGGWYRSLISAQLWHFLVTNYRLDGLLWIVMSSTWGVGLALSRRDEGRQEHGYSYRGDPKQT